MPAFGVMGWAMPRVLCEAILARSACFLIILRQSSPRRDPERSRRDISPSLTMHPPATQKSATTLSPLHGRNNDREHLPPSPPQQMPRLPIALPPRALALNIRIEPQILASRKRLHRNHIPHITRLNVHHQR